LSSKKVLVRGGQRKINVAGMCAGPRKVWKLRFSVALGEQDAAPLKLLAAVIAK
jgi:hypothetical protein